MTTVSNIDSGAGVVRPPPAPAPAPPPSDTGGASGSKSVTPVTSPSVGARMWKIDATFEMMTTSPIFRDEYDSSVKGVALTLADRLMWATEVPMSRFAFWLPTPGGTMDASNVIFCESNNNEHLKGGWVSRFSTATNTTFRCEPQKHQLNATGPVLLQRTSTAEKAKSLTFEVGVYPASGVSGDIKPAVQVAEELVEIANSGDEPERILQKTGLWSYKAGPGVKFHGLFPGSAAAMPGADFDQRDTSLPLGPNPGGHGAEPAPKPLPGQSEANAMKEAALADVDTVVHEAKQINMAVSNSLQELKDSLARASAVHAAWMTWNPYKPPADLLGP